MMEIYRRLCGIRDVLAQQEKAKKAVVDIIDNPQKNTQRGMLLNVPPDMSMPMHIVQEDTSLSF